MWTTFEKTNSNTNSGSNIINVNNPYSSAIDIRIEVGNWIAVEPYSDKCEIRQVTAVTNTSGNIAITVANNFLIPHNSNTTIVFVQTSPNWDILLFGAKINDVNGTYPIQNRDGINAAIKDCNLNGGGIVSIPKGVYEVAKLKSASCCINVSGFDNIKFIGEGMGVSELRLAPGDYFWFDTHLFQCYNCSNLEWHHLTLNGNYAIYKQTGAYNEKNPKNGDKGQFHLIETGNVCDNFIVDTVELKNAIMDGIRIMDFDLTPPIGDKTLPVECFIIRNCLFNSCGRNGITGQRNTANVIIKGCYFTYTKNSDIDQEPTYNSSKYDSIDDNIPASPNKWVITENIFERNPKGNTFIALSLTGVGKSKIEENFIVSNNIFQNGAVMIAICRNVVFDNNLIIAGWNQETDSTDIPFYGVSLINKFVFTNNIIINKRRNKYPEKNAASLKSCFCLVGAAGDYVPKTTLGITISNNTFENGGYFIESCANVSLNHNKVKLPSDADDIGMIINYSYPPSVFIVNEFVVPPNIDSYGNLKITDNEIVCGTMGTGIRINCNNAAIPLPIMKLLHIDHNEIKGNRLQYGINIMVPNVKGGGGVEQECWRSAIIGTSNIIDDCQQQKIAVSGSWMMGMSEVPAYWIARTNPEGILAAMQGSIAIDKNRVADNKLIKNQVVDALTGSKAKGWELQSEAGRQILFKDTFHGITNIGNLLGTTNPPIVNPNISTIYHAPEINVFSSAWSILYPTVSPNTNGVWTIDTVNKIAKGASGNYGGVMNFVDSVVDCEIKMLIQAAQPSQYTSNPRCGIFFRLDNSLPTKPKYWRLCLEYPVIGAPPTIVANVILAYCDFQPSYSISFPLTVFPPSGKCVLKVLLKGDYISAFYNDLLIFNIKNSTNASFTKHGMITNNNGGIFAAEYFNILMH